MAKKVSKSASANAIAERKAKSKAPKRMKQIFVGKVFSFSGDFGQNWSHEQMANWIKAHGGRYEKEVFDDTTHLICSMEHYVQKTEQGKSQAKLPIDILLIIHAVKKALALKTQCHIVARDWLEDCLIGHATRKRCRAEKPYTIGRVLKRIRNGLDKQKEYRVKFEDGVRASYELVDNRKGHLSDLCSCSELTCYQVLTISTAMILDSNTKWFARASTRMGRSSQRSTPYT
jgi:hypothetical protein